MLASELLWKPPLHGSGLSVSSLRIVLVSGELLYREGMRWAFRQAQSLVLLDGITMADAIEAAKRQLADLVLIDANNLTKAIEKAKVVISCAADVPLVALTATASTEELEQCPSSPERPPTSKLREPTWNLWSALSQSTCAPD